MTTYFSAARHAWPSLLFLFPLIVTYELGVFSIGGNNPDSLRAGADVWLRKAFDHFGVQQVFALPGVLLLFLFAMTLLNWSERPKRAWLIPIPMTLESVVLALGLWTIAWNFPAILAYFHAPNLQIQAIPSDAQKYARLIGTIGTGIYEEVIFRLALFGGLCFLLRWAFIPAPIAVLLAGMTSAILFSVAHHIGSQGENFNQTVFLFRVAAGLFFAMVFALRGLGIAVGTHIAYDLLVEITAK